MCDSEQQLRVASKVTCTSVLFVCYLPCCSFVLDGSVLQKDFAVRLLVVVTLHVRC